MSLFSSGFARSSAAMAGYALVIAVLTAATLSFASVMAGVVLIWPVNAVAVSLLNRQPPSRWPSWLGITAAAMVAGDIAIGLDPRLIGGFAAINLAEIVTVAAIVRRGDIEPWRLHGYLRIVIAAMAGAAISTPLAMALMRLIGNPVTVEVAARWFAASAMGMVVLIPAFDAMRRDMPDRPPRLSFGLLLLPVPVAAAGVIVFGNGGLPLLFVLMPCGVFAAFRYGFVGAATSTLTIAVVATTFTIRGVGPIATAAPAMTDRILLLQLFLSAITLTAFPVATLLYHRQRALAQVRAAERELRLVTDHSNDLILRIGMDGIRRYASSAASRLLGVPPEALVGQSAFATMHPDDRAGMRRVARLLVAGGGEGEGVVRRYRQQHRDGHYVWLEGAFRLAEGEGRALEVIATIRDITARQVAEQAATAAIVQLEERQRLLNMAESAAQIGHWRIDPADRRVLWSPEVFRIHGMSPGEEPPYDIAIECYHPDDRAMVRAQIDRALAGGGAFAFEARLIRPDGALRWVMSRGQAEHAPDGRIVGVFGVFQDTTDHVTTIAELRAAREDAERALAARATFTATMSHEIRTPLTAILAAAQLLRETPDRTERMRHLDSLEQAGRALSDIVDDVLTFSKLEAGQGEPEAIAFEPAELVATVTGMFAADAATHAIALGSDTGQGRVLGDPARLRRVLTNLIGNAIKFTRAGSVRVTAMPSGGDLWCFDVADTGVGIRDDRLEAIFEPFVQADASTTRSYGGTGLGLSISRMLVESMGGTIGVDSRPGDGSRFWFTLPLPAAPAAPVLSPPAAPPSPVRARTVLVAEDNDTNRYLIAEIIRRLGHAVVAVENGARAVEYATGPAGHPIDVVLMDVQMPVMDGIAATRAIRAWGGSGAGVPIHALTADLSAERRAAVIEAGMNGVLAKPVDVAALRAVIEGVDTDPAARPATGAAGTAQAIDPVRIRALGDTLGIAARDTLLSLLIEDARRVPERLRALATAQRFDLARREAHGLRGAAASVGAAGLVAILQAIETGDDDGAIDPASLDTLDRRARAVVDAARAVIGPPTPGP